MKCGLMVVHFQSTARPGPTTGLRTNNSVAEPSPYFCKMRSSKDIVVSWVGETEAPFMKKCLP